VVSEILPAVDQSCFAPRVHSVNPHCIRLNKDFNPFLISFCLLHSQAFYRKQDLLLLLFLTVNTRFVSCLFVCTFNLSPGEGRDLFFCSNELMYVSNGLS